jgi:hypothetical protein
MATQIFKPQSMRIRPFMRRHLPSMWGVSRICRFHHKVNLRTEHITQAMKEWIEEQPGFYYRSEGNKVFYFSEPSVALLFKMRFFGDTDENP